MISYAHNAKKQDMEEHLFGKFEKLKDLYIHKMQYIYIYTLDMKKHSIRT